MPILQREKLRFKGVTLAACLVPKGVTGPVSWEFPNYFSTCTVGSPHPTLPFTASLIGRRGYQVISGGRP